MALSKSAAGAGTKSVLVLSASAGSGGAVYTVPNAKVFKGWIIAYNAASSQLSIYINGNQTTTALGNSQGNETWAPFVFPPGTTLTNDSSDYFILTGELVDGS